MLNRQTAHSPKQSKTLNSKAAAQQNSSKSRNSAPQLAAALLAAGAGEISQLSGVLASGGAGSNIAMLALAEQQSMDRGKQDGSAARLLAEGIPHFGEALPENLAPTGDIPVCTIPSEAQGLPTAELSWFGG
ncbi:MAG: hypothetical protein ACI4JY_05215 [Oscillospiraceae bacterium]